MKCAGGILKFNQMTAYCFTLFETAIGRCAIVWGGRGIVGAQLPEACETETRRRLLDRFPDAREASPPPNAARAKEGIAALLRGETSDLSTIALDMDAAPPFRRRVYEATRAILPGETQTYGAIAQKIGAAGAARAVGQALGRNPFALLVPCHRVLAANGKLGGFSAHGGLATKLRLLAIEGAQMPTAHAWTQNETARLL
jgi:methylated-DNA-[protein]-cysteine S-methyltransferase